MSECSEDNVVRVGNLAVSLKWKAVLIEDKPLQLGRRLYQLLELLCGKKGQIVTNGELNALFLGGSSNWNLLKVSMNKLRQKIGEANRGESYIDNVPGKGYLLKDPTDDP